MGGFVLFVVAGLFIFWFLVGGVVPGHAAVEIAVELEHVSGGIVV